MLGLALVGGATIGSGVPTGDNERGASSDWGDIENENPRESAGFGFHR